MSSRGVFLLSDILEQQLEGTGVSTSEVFIQAAPISTPNIGYFGGGTPALSIVDKISYSDDTTARVPTADLTIGRQGLCATSSQTGAYFAGGRIPAHQTVVDKITYSTDTSARVPGADLSAARSYSSAVANINAGYFCGGTPGPGPMSTVDKCTFSTDTTARVPGADLSNQVDHSAAAGNQTAGYITGGNFPVLSVVDKLTYNSDTTARIPTADLVSGYYDHSGSSSPSAAYFGAGFSPGLTTRLSTLDKLTYSSDSTAAIPSSGDLSIGRVNGAATGSSTSGYFGGGSSPADISTMDRVTYSDDTTTAVPGAALSDVRANFAAASSKDNAFPPTITFPATQFITGYVNGPDTGYSGGGYAGAPTGNVSTTDKTDLPTDTTSAAASANLTRSTYGTGAVSSNTAGYWGGGQAAQSTTDKCTYSTDTTAVFPGANLTLQRYYLYGIGNKSAGYFGGGYNAPASLTIMDKLTYSSETTANVSTGNLSQDRYAMSAVGDAETAYWIGGYRLPGSNVSSTADKLTYSTDTTSNIASLTNPAPQYGFATIGNTTDGYFVGGFESSYLTNVFKINYGTETRTSVPGATQSTGKFYSTGIGNLTAGLITGGTNGSEITTIDKITFATETTAATPGNLSQPRHSLNGISAHSFGLPQPPAVTPTAQTVSVPIPAGPNPSYDFGYTMSGPGYTGNYKLNFSDDTYTRTPTNLPSDWYAGGAHSSSTHGYHTGGRYPSGDYNSTTHKVSYADDTWSSGGDAVTGTQYCSASNSTTAGYVFAGGLSVSPFRISTTQKYTYSSDSYAAVPGAATAESQQGGAFGNVSVGYYTSSNPSSPRTKYKITYSDDTSAANPFISDALQTNRPTAASSPSGGYLMAGSVGTTVVKTTFSTDTAARLPGADLPAGSQSFTGGMGSTTAGYVCGGYNPGAPNVQSIIQKVNFSNDTSSALSGTMDTGEYWRTHLSSKTCHVAGAGSSSPVIC